MPDPTLETIRVPVFFGRNTYASPHDVSTGESIDDLNVDGETPGAVRKRRGITKFSPIHLGTDAITGLYRYYRRNGDKHLMAFCGTQLWAGSGTPPDLHVVKSGYTAGTWMAFSTMQDRLYTVNHTDTSWRWDSTDFRRIGLSAPMRDVFAVLPWVSVTVSNTTDGRLTYGYYYYYKFSLDWGSLGESNLGPDVFAFQLTGGGTENTATLTRLDLLLPGKPGSLVPAEAGLPVKIWIWRGIGSATSLYSGGSIRRIHDQPYYRVASVDVGDGMSPISYVDILGDDELVDQYQGHSLSEPYGDLLPNHIYWGFGLESRGYQVTPRARYIAKHKNRMWYANVLEHSWDLAKTLTVTDQTSRVYWSKLYQADIFEDFMDVYPEDGDHITGLAAVGEHLVVFKNRHIYAIFGSGPSTFEVRLLDPSIGCVAPRSICPVEHSVFFLGHDGVYSYSGGEVVRVSDKIRPDILAIDRVNREYAAGGSWQNRYYLAIPGAT